MACLRDAAPRGGVTRVVGEGRVTHDVYALCLYPSDSSRLGQRVDMDRARHFLVFVLYEVYAFVG